MICRICNLVWLHILRPFEMHIALNKLPCQGEKKDVGETQ
jgi:hypothetical protein